MQITNVNASPQTQISSGQVMFSNDSFNLDNSFSQRLCLYDGTLTTNYNDNFIVEIIGGCGDEVLLLKVHDKFDTPTTLSLNIWQENDIVVENTGFKRYLKNPAEWNNLSLYQDNNIVSITRGSESDEKVHGAMGERDIANETVFGYTIAMSVIGANIMYNISENKIEVLKHNVDYFVIIANPSRLKNKTRDTLSIAKNMVSKIDFCEQVNKYKEFWHKFWEKSFIMQNGNNNDYVENMYYISKYMFACGMLGELPMHFINGVFRHTGDSNFGSNWSPAYWWYNQRDLYNGLFATGDFDFIEVFINLYKNSMQRNIEDTRYKFPNSEGMIVPETMGWDGNRFFSDNEYVGPIFCAGAEISLMMYNKYLYTNDIYSLKNIFYPYAKQIALFYISYVLTKNEAGKYIIEAGKSNAREAFWLVKDSITDLSAIRSLFPKIIEFSTDIDFINKLKDILENLVPFHIGNTPERYLYGDPNFEVNQTNVDDPCMELLYPYNLCGIDSDNRSLILNNYEYRVGRHQKDNNISWDNSNIWAARLGLGNESYNNTCNYIASTQIFHSGKGTDGNCVFEFNGNLINALNESNLQSYDGRIRIFPALPMNLKELNAKFSLYARGGFIVSSEYTSTVYANYVGIKSIYGNIVRLINPWGNSKVKVTNCNTNHSFDLCGTELNFDTVRDNVYLIENYKFLIDESQEKIISTPNMSKKIFEYDGFSVQLGN